MKKLLIAASVLILSACSVNVGDEDCECEANLATEITYCNQLLAVSYTHLTLPTKA